VAFVLKLIVLLQLKDHPLTAPDAGLDTTAYVELAKKVVDGNWGHGEYKLGHSADAQRHALAALAVNPDDALAKQLAALK